MRRVRKIATRRREEIGTKSWQHHRMINYCDPLNIFVLYVLRKQYGAVDVTHHLWPGSSIPIWFSSGLVLCAARLRAESPTSNASLAESRLRDIPPWGLLGPRGGEDGRIFLVLITRVKQAVQLSWVKISKAAGSVRSSGTHQREIRLWGEQPRRRAQWVSSHLVIRNNQYRNILVFSS